MRVESGSLHHLSNPARGYRPKSPASECPPKSAANLSSLVETPSSSAPPGWARIQLRVPSACRSPAPRSSPLVFPTRPDNAPYNGMKHRRPAPGSLRHQLRLPFGPELSLRASPPTPEIPPRRQLSLTNYQWRSGRPLPPTKTSFGTRHWPFFEKTHNPLLPGRPRASHRVIVSKVR